MKQLNKTVVSCYWRGQGFKTVLKMFSVLFKILGLGSSSVQFSIICADPPRLSQMAGECYEKSNEHI